jgi:Xaa-Pro aminopeptidase
VSERAERASSGITATVLPPIGYAERPAAVRARLDGHVLIVSTASNVRWLTGFGGTLGWVIIGPDRFAIVTDGRYAERAGADVEAAGVGAEIVVGRTRPEIRDLVVATAGSGHPVLAEAAHLSHAAWTDFAKDLTLEADHGTIATLRRVKAEGELARIARAAEIADAALGEVAPMLSERLTETDVRNDLDQRMRRLGADGLSYEPIVASGPELAARPHHQTGRRTIVEGDTVIIDVGALVDGYHSDMTRTFVVGEPTEQQTELYELVRTAQHAGLEAVIAGLPARELDATCRSVFEEAGYGDWFIHGTGHGVGLDIHEEPFAARSSADELVAGDVVTVEPGLYRGGFGGIRIEDLVTVTSTGCRILTHLPKDSPCLPSRPTT